MFEKLVRGILMESTIISRTHVRDFIISTVDSPDLGPETAIIDKYSAHPVERYDSIDLAKEGHKKWVKFIKDGNVEITKLGYPGLVGDEKITLNKKKD